MKKKTNRPFDERRLYSSDHPYWMWQKLKDKLILVGIGLAITGLYYLIKAIIPAQ